MKAQVFDPYPLVPLPTNWFTIMNGHCAPPEGAADAELARDLLPGGYQLTMSVTCGWRTPAKVTAALELRTASPDDRFEGSGEKVDEARPTSFYGWIDGPLVGASAPVRPDWGGGWDPASRDPGWPGVLARSIEGPGLKWPAMGTPKKSYILSVGGAFNHRSPGRKLEWAGFGMVIQSWDGRCYHGAWFPIAQLDDATGRFALCPT